jgi:hypothetical protein
LYRIAQSMISAVATIWIPPSAMNTPAWMAMARAVVRSEACGVQELGRRS